MNTKSPSIIVISAPSGTGKTTIVKELIKGNKNLVASISYTTRKKRSNEIDGKDYNFITSELFSKMVDEESFLEHAKVFDCFYGTPKKEVEDSLRNGLNVILEIDWQGAIQIKREKPDCLMVFIIPPSKEELMLRLKKRGTDTNDEIQLRFDEALNDINHYEYFDKVFINADVGSTVRTIAQFIKEPGTRGLLDDEIMKIIHSFRKHRKA